MIAAAALGWVLQALARVPVDPDREQAQTWAREELARREYRANEQPWVTRLITWVFDLIDRLNLPNSPQTSVSAGLLILAFAAVAGFALRRVGGARRQARRRGPSGLFGDVVTTAAEHRAAADGAAARGDYSLAVLERFRAVVRELEERTVLTALPGRTAAEVAAVAGRELPDLAGDLHRGATLFDDVRYGDRTATVDADQHLRALDAAVRSARTVPA